MWPDRRLAGHVSDPPHGISCQLGAGSLQCSLASKGTVSRVLFLGPGLRPPVAFFWDSS